MYDIEDETQCSDTGRREGLLVSDSEGAIVKTTESVERMTGYTMEDLLAMQLSDLFWTPNMDDSGGSLGTTLSGTDGPTRLVLDCADGTHATVELYSHTVSSDTQTRVYTTLRSPTGADSLATPPVNGASMTEAEALRQLHRQAMEGTGVADTAKRLLALGRDYLGLEDGALARIDDGTYEVAYTAGEAEAYEPGLSVPVGDTVAEGVATDSAAATLAFVEAAGTATQGYPFTDAGGTYVGAPVVVEGEMYGVVEFTGPGSHEETVGQNEREFVELLAQWIGHEIERDRRIKQLERYETVLEAVDDPVYALDTDARFTFANEAAQREFGYGQEIIGEHVSIGMDEADIQRVAGQRQELVETDARSKTAQFELETADGGRRLVENRLALIGEQGFEGTAGVLRDVTDREQRRRQLESFQQAIEEAADGVAILEGEPDRVLATAADVTERKERQSALAESKQRYQTLLRAAPDPVFIADAETGEIVETNAAAAALRGESQDDIVGRNQSDLHPSGDADAYRTVFEDAVGAKTMVSELPDGSQLELCTADGEAVPVEINADTVDLPQGEMIYGVFRDISDRVEKQRELELKERAMDEANVGITISDPDRPDNPLIYVNKGFVDQTGYSREAVLGRNCRFLQQDEQDQPSLDTLRDAIASEEPVTVELRNYRKDGEQFWNRLSVTPVYNEAEQLVNYIGIQHDVTNERTIAQRLRTLHGTTRDLLETDDITDAATVAVETICQQLDVAVAEVYRRDAEELVRLVSRGSESLATPAQGLLDPTPAWDAIESDGLVVSETDESPITTTAYFPIEGHGVVAVGVRDPAELDDSTRQLMEILTGNLVAVLDTFERNRELTRERERFQLLTESVDEYAFLIVDEDGDIATWNDGAASLFGYDAETAVGMSTAQLHPPPDRESGLTERLLQQARTAGESAHEGTRVRADGSEFYADVRYAPLETDDGEFRGYAKIVRDMTERRRQQRRTERFVEQADDVVTVLDTDGTVTYASGSAERVLGYEPDDIVGENLFDYLHPDGREHAMRTFNDCVDGEADVQAECRLRAPDGGWFNVEGRCRNMLDDDAVDGILVYLRDVTDIKERARRFESLFNQTYQFTGLLEPDGTVIETNEAALDFGGLDRTEIVGESFADAPWWTHSEDMNDRVRNAIQRAGEGEFVRYETEVWGSQGVGIIDFSVKPVTDEDGAVSMLVVEGRDITEQNRRREHLQVIQRVMRHNMRNDLTKLRGFTEALYKFTDAESATKYFERIEAILDKWTDMTEMASQIRQVLEGQQHSEASTGAGELVDDAAAVADGMAVETTVTNDLPGQAAPEIPALMTEAVRELIENAAEAASGPDAQVTVTLSRADDNWVDITVADNGPGLPDEEARVLRTGEETSLTHGQGLGLWMVRMLTKQVGGNVSVDVADDGTTVTLQIPTSDHLSIES